MVVLVTGASGFVGRPAVTELRRRGFEVHGVGRREPADLAIDAWHTIDLLDGRALHALLTEVAPSHLLHLAWCTEHGRFWDDPANDEWTEATVRLAATFQSTGGSRLVFAGSCAQYGWSDAALAPDGVARETTTPRAPVSRYGKAKEAASEALDALADETNLTVATGLVFSPFGPHEKPVRLVPSVVRRLLAGELAETTAGSQERDFLHVTDCGAAFAALVESDVTGSVNIGSGQGASVSEVATTIARLLVREDSLRLGALASRGGEPQRLVADVHRLHDEVGFNPTFALEAGLSDSIHWWQEHERGQEDVSGPMELG